MVRNYVIVCRICPVLNYTGHLIIVRQQIRYCFKLREVADEVKMEASLSIRQKGKTLSEKEKLPVTGNFSFSLNVFFFKCSLWFVLQIVRVENPNPLVLPTNQVSLYYCFRHATLIVLGNLFSYHGHANELYGKNSKYANYILKYLNVIIGKRNEKLTCFCFQ